MSVAAPIATDRRGAVFERTEAARPARAFEPQLAEAIPLPRRFRGRTLLLLLVFGQAVWFVVLGYLFVRLGT